eukprot:TRINITY_DN11283_c0_g1_i2.p1 TRINITY_DN11283_c0_g1~~TRINITY_DN11283_c0_g1_i2.p1  ORF type:complete len:189 (+),score=32.61 TRINITY_DN11283_c0_g1_i2:40-606(+)
MAAIDVQKLLDENFQYLQKLDASRSASTRVTMSAAEESLLFQIAQNLSKLIVQLPPNAVSAQAVAPLARQSFIHARPASRRVPPAPQEPPQQTPMVTRKQAHPGVTPQASKKKKARQTYRDAAPAGVPTFVIGDKCQHCGTRKTPNWRIGPDFSQLCNECGVWFKKFQEMRPLAGAGVGTGDDAMDVN